MKMFNETLTRLMLACMFLGLFLYMPRADTLLIDLTTADPATVAFFQIGALAGFFASIFGGGS
jgi:hypothetical protein